MTALCGRLNVLELVEVLKWPFCLGEARKLVLAGMEQKTGGKFNSDHWDFVENVNSGKIPGLDRKTLDQPPAGLPVVQAFAEIRKLHDSLKDKPEPPAP